MIERIGYAILCASAIGYMYVMYGMSPMLLTFSVVASIGVVFGNFEGDNIRRKRVKVTYGDRFPDEWEEYIVKTSKHKNKKYINSKDTKHALYWTASGGSVVPYPPKKEGSIREFGDGVRIRIGEHDITMNYTDLLTLKVLLAVEESEGFKLEDTV